MRHLDTDKYEIGPQIGVGTCGTVHMCRERETGEHFAIKVVDLRKLALSAGGISLSELAAEAEVALVDGNLRMHLFTLCVLC